MTKYLFTTLLSNDLGLLTRSLPIATELAKREHEIVFCSPGPAPSKLIADAGFANVLPRHPIYHLMAMDISLRSFYRFIRAEPFKETYGTLLNFLRQLLPSLPLKTSPITAEIWNIDHISAMTGMLNKNFVRSLSLSLMDLMAELAIDAVVDFWNPMACIAARAMHIPLFTVIQADMHPDSRGFIWWKPAPSDIPSPVPAINKVLAELSLDPIHNTGELCVGDQTLVVGIHETDPLPEGSDVTYIGPILWQKEAIELPAWFDDLSRERPVIWVYSGNPNYLPRLRSPVDSAVVLRACIAALAERDMQVVLTTGYHALPKDCLPLPPNFRYASYVPGLAMAERSDLLIHHGGYGSCQTGLYTGTPAVIIPTFSERESNARRVAQVGAGELLLPDEGVAWKKHVRAEALRAKVDKVLSNPAYAENARRIQEKLRAYGGAPEAARLIEEKAS